MSSMKPDTQTLSFFTKMNSCELFQFFFISFQTLEGGMESIYHFPEYWLFRTYGLRSIDKSAIHLQKKDCLLLHLSYFTSCCCISSEFLTVDDDS